MSRLIKRYESRKLYDTEESRYVSLEELAEWIRTGEEVEVVDNATGADVTAQTLTQIILDEGRRGSSFLPSALLHELVRAGEKAVHSGVERVQTKVDELLQASFDRLGPVRHARTEMARLRNRLEELESSLASLEVARGGAVRGARSARAPRREGSAPAGRRPAVTTTTKSRPVRRKKGDD